MCINVVKSELRKYNSLPNHTQQQWSPKHSGITSWSIMGGQVNFWWIRVKPLKVNWSRSYVIWQRCKSQALHLTGPKLMKPMRDSISHSSICWAPFPAMSRVTGRIWWPLWFMHTTVHCLLLWDLVHTFCCLGIIPFFQQTLILG